MAAKKAPPGKQANINIPHVNSIKTSTKIPKVNLNAAQQMPPTESKIPERFHEEPKKQIGRLQGGDSNPYSEFYQDQLVAFYELPHRSPLNWIIPEDLNQNRFLASPLNARGIMQTHTIFDVNLLRTNQLY